MLLSKLHRRFFLNKNWLSQGIFSVFFKLFGTIFQIAALRHFCHRADETIFSEFLLFQGVISLTPYIDFGKGGLSLRKKLMDVQDESVFFSSISQLFFVYFVWFVIYACFTQDFMVGFLLFMRVPFAMQADAFYAYGENNFRALLDFFEMLTLSFLIIFLSQCGLDSFYLKVSYSAVLFLNALTSYFIFLKKRGWRARNLINSRIFEGFFSKSDMVHCLYTFIFSSYLVGFQWVINLSYREYNLFTFNAIFKVLSLFLGAFLILFNPLINEIKRQNIIKEAAVITLLLVLIIEGFLVVFGSQAFSFFTGKPLQDPVLFYLMICWMGTTAGVFLMDHYLRMTQILLSVFLMGMTYILWAIFGYLIPSIYTWLVLSIAVNLFSITIGSVYIRADDL